MSTCIQREQEIKFDDERTVYAMLHSSVKRALGINTLKPTMDFETDAPAQLFDR